MLHHENFLDQPDKNLANRRKGDNSRGVNDQTGEHKVTLLSSMFTFYFAFGNLCFHKGDLSVRSRQQKKICSIS